MDDTKDEPAWKALAAGLGWVAMTYVLEQWGAYLVPSSLKPMPLETFGTIRQVVVTVVGLGLTFLLVRRPAGLLGISPPSPLALVQTTLAAPMVFVLAAWLGFQIAMPTLVEELRRGGLAVATKNLGEYGRILKQAPVVVVLLWVSLIAPLTEELAFRGALWGGLERSAARLFGRGAKGSGPGPSEAGDRQAAQVSPGEEDDEPLPSGIIQKTFVEEALEAMVRATRGQGAPTAATLLQAAIFGAMHMGTPGGVGIIILVSSTVLGVFCGLARQLSGGIAAPVLLHVLYNAIGLGNARGWFVTEQFPKEGGVPTLMALIGGVCVIAMLPVWLIQRRRAAASPNLGASS